MFWFQLAEPGPSQSSDGFIGKWRGLPKGALGGPVLCVHRENSLAHRRADPSPHGDLGHLCPGLCVVDTWASLFIWACTPCTPLLALPTRMIIVVFASSTNSFMHSLILQIQTAGAPGVGHCAGCRRDRQIKWKHQNNLRIPTVSDTEYGLLVM